MTWCSPSKKKIGEHHMIRVGTRCRTGSFDRRINRDRKINYLSTLALRSAQISSTQLLIEVKFLRDQKASRRIERNSSPRCSALRYSGRPSLGSRSSPSARWSDVLAPLSFGLDPLFRFGRPIDKIFPDELVEGTEGHSCGHDWHRPHACGKSPAHPCHPRERAQLTYPRRPPLPCVRGRISD